MFNRPGCDSDGDFFVVSSNGSEEQNCRKGPHPPQIQGNAWHITIDELHADSKGPESNIEIEDRISKLNTGLQAFLGAQFEQLLGKM